MLLLPAFSKVNMTDWIFYMMYNTTSGWTAGRLELQLLTRFSEILHEKFLYNRRYFLSSYSQNVKNWIDLNFKNKKILVHVGFVCICVQTFITHTGEWVLYVSIYTCVCMFTASDTCTEITESRCLELVLICCFFVCLFGWLLGFFNFNEVSRCLC